MKINFKKLSKEATIPYKKNDDDAGFDLTAISKEDKGKYIEYDTGIAVEIPKGHMGLIFPRSSISEKHLFLANSVGLIDPQFRGSLKLRFRFGNPTKNDDIYQVGDRIGQLVITPIPEVEFVEVDELNETERSEGGFGSTGQ